MMPWEHAIAGYIGYSLTVHAIYRDPPSTRETVVVVVAALLPDLIDKPLAWEFDLWASGHALGHSLFAAAPASLVVLWIAYTQDRTRVGIAFVVGYLSHLVGDVAPQWLLTRETRIDRVLWPIGGGGNGYDTGFREELLLNLHEYTRWVSEEAVADDPHPYALLLLGVVGFGGLLWLYDGMPVARDVYRVARRVLRFAARSS